MIDPSTQKFLELLAVPGFAFAFSLLAIWALVWKGIALWKAARNGHKKWFIAMLILNTIGILEIVYIFYFSKPKANSSGQNISS